MTRREKVLEKLSEEALLVTNPMNVRYLTGFTGSNGQLLLTKDSVFFTDGRYITQSAQQVTDIDRQIYTQGSKLTDLLAKALADRGLTRLGVEASHVTLATMQRLRDGLSGIDLVETTDVVEGVRVIKDDKEIDATRRAQRVTEEAQIAALQAWTSGLETDLAMDLERRIRERTDGLSFDIIVASGAHAALPHAEPRREPVEIDDLVLIDIGSRTDGYCSDMTRTYLGPNASAEMRKVHETVLAALEAGCAAVKPGARCVDIDKACRDLLSEAGYGEYFTHSTGHGVGLDIHESPAFSPSSDDVLAPGMIVTIEPGVYLPGVGGVRIEDLLVVTEDGAENLTNLPRGSQLPS
jgi:Xaa-Pro aminopeptidase